MMDAGAVDTKSNIKEDLAQLLEVLDETSRAILWYLWWHRHAEISELRNLIDASGDFEILYRLKDVINQNSQRLWGKPIVGFEESRTDPPTGERVFFSWWLLDEDELSISSGNRLLADTFNEKENITIFAQLPTIVDLVHPEISCKNGILRISLKKLKKEEPGC